MISDVVQNDIKFLCPFFRKSGRLFISEVERCFWKLANYTNVEYSCYCLSFP